MGIEHRRPAKIWEFPFLAIPERVAHLRRTVSAPLRLWGVRHLEDPVRLCVTELITNVITHVGPRTPTWISIVLDGSRLRIAIRDPDPRRFPALRAATPAQEGGRGLHLIAATADRWGVIPSDYGKTTWCELATGLPGSESRPAASRMLQTEALLTVYGRLPALNRASSPAVRLVAEEEATALIADLLH
ncbi:ATP-binding protein [Streptomyces sp. NPDC037389]|uniref:ATP-binding protein n=1 Tax=Streptomyces sp. NPDC037389 TaxID=3155369 RepID=UPI0033ED46C9